MGGDEGLRANLGPPLLLGYKRNTVATLVFFFLLQDNQILHY